MLPACYREINLNQILLLSNKFLVLNYKPKASFLFTSFSIGCFMFHWNFGPWIKKRKPLDDELREKINFVRSHKSIVRSHFVGKHWTATGTRNVMARPYQTHYCNYKYTYDNNISIKNINFSDATSYVTHAWNKQFYYGKTPLTNKSRIKPDFLYK